MNSRSKAFDLHRALPALAALALAPVLVAAPSDPPLLGPSALFPPNDAGPLDNYPGSLALDGQRAVVGLANPIQGGSPGGVAYVYRRAGSGWELEATLADPQGEHGDGFGASVALEGSLCAVGSPFSNGIEQSSGRVAVFRHDGTQWVMEALLLAADVVQNAHFGFRVDISDGRIFIGAPHQGPSPSAPGAVYVFEKIDDLWREVEKVTLAPSEGITSLGLALAASGERLLIGAARDDDQGYDSGSAFVFRRSGFDWIQEAKLLASDGAPIHLFGTGVDLLGERALIGAPGDGHAGVESGAAYVFELVGGQWTETQKLVGHDSVAHESYGARVALGRDLACVGVHGHDHGVYESGAIYAYRPCGATWLPTFELRLPDADPSDELGQMAIDEASVIGGAPGYDAGTNAGAVFAFELDEAPIVPYCFGDGSFRPCPCGNESALGGGAGCLHAPARGGELAAQGGTSVSADDLTFVACDLNPNQAALLFVALERVDDPATPPLGDGLRCAGLGVVRLGIRVPDASGSAEWGPGLAATGGWSDGDLRRFQVWYRDVAGGPCGNTFNTTNGVEVAFSP